jgi:hypothetical protein
MAPNPVFLTALFEAETIGMGGKAKNETTGFLAILIVRILNGEWMLVPKLNVFMARNDGYSQCVDFETDVKFKTFQFMINKMRTKYFKKILKIHCFENEKSLGCQTAQDFTMPGK